MQSLITMDQCNFSSFLLLSPDLTVTSVQVNSVYTVFLAVRTLTMEPRPPTASACGKGERLQSHHLPHRTNTVEFSHRRDYGSFPKLETVILHNLTIFWISRTPVLHVTDRAECLTSRILEQERKRREEGLASVSFKQCKECFLLKSRRWRRL